MEPALLNPRAVADAPGGYAPADVSCPSPLPVIRPADALSPQETSWLNRSTNATTAALVSVLERANIQGMDVRAYLTGIADSGGMVPRIGIALSGGGYRILQASTYPSGLSGGSWLVGSLYTLNFTTVESIVDATVGSLNELWQFNETIIEGPATLSIREYYQQLTDAVDVKEGAGFDTSITDYWGRALSYQLFNATDGAPAYTFSSIAGDSSFAATTIPMPIIVAVERPAGQIQILENSTVFEFNPWEMGSYDPGNPAFAPLRYVGSAFDNGTVVRGRQCVAGVDNVGFVVGTSSSLFNQGFLQLGRSSPDVPDFFIRAINETLANLSEQNSDIARWPNPFFHYQPTTNQNANSETLNLVDGGEDLQNIPFHPLLWSRRAVDVILAVESSADTTTHWPNGTSLVATYQRSISNFTAPSEEKRFPRIPDINTIINVGLNSRPTFFGCEPENPASPGPLVVYLPNVPYTNYSNVSTFQLEYTTEQRQAIILNGYNVATMGNATIDAQWPACLGCAILDRTLRRTGTPVPAVCGECFQRYCWNGTVDESTPPTYEPSLIVGSSGGEQVYTSPGGLVLIRVGCLLDSHPKFFIAPPDPRARWDDPGYEGLG
ncbi:lysophospholipase catalytic domain-containing protein [Staphylotrichum tortipilum]|uniref:Lysophospholipase n=1 Tax=Staphylotrichum tortipilum TaxID=2831512 RepID=A0AAN6M9U7_9PEZI|nr:lysophospholipase catalytic domain-containing protein [Staphylotrichum longicolle]